MWKVTGIAAATNKDGRLALVATAGITGTRDAVWQLEELNSTGWSLLEEWLGGDPKDSWEGPARPAVAANADGRFEVVAIGTDAKTGKIWHARQDSTAPGGWSGWKSLGTPPGQRTVETPPALARNKNGRLELFIVDKGSAVWHRWQEQAGGDRWAAWHSLNKPGQHLKIKGSLAVTQNKDGRLELFVTASDGAVWHIWQDPRAPGGWSGWQSLKSPSGPSGQIAVSGPPAAVQNQDGRLELFVTAKDGAVWHLRQDPTAPGGWSGWELVGRQGAGFIEVAAAVRPTGPLVLFAIGDPSGGVTYDLWSRERAGPTNAWRPWRSHADLLQDSGLNPGQIESPTLALLPESDAVVVVLFLRIAGQVSLRRLRSIIPPGSASPLLWAVDSMELQLPPESRV
jgi:hypothetical protein